ncbi:MAG TPA: hypothetical protein VLI41_07640 [Phenylobacterium sp.]|uniref:hypothetical protein n=1 Tax=Phenylobacterium sp. TaxID=1871053 RepID=UPI002BF84ADB|nr:hypothetical protein [Phenylobacterium sp.]HSV03065.1 hypothetical protein [Phenylobacterium sp.]
MNACPRAMSAFAEAAIEGRPPPLRPRAGPRRPGRRTVVRLWLPLTPLLLLLAPFAIALAPLGFLAPARFRPNPFLAVFAIGGLLLSLGGTDVRVDTREAHLRLKIL